MASSSVPVYLKDENLTQETRDLLSSLPTEKGWLVSQMYQFEGIWQTQALVQGIVNCQKHFEANDSDVILATLAKSGTTWLKALLFALIHQNKFPVSGNHPLLATNPHPLVPYLEGDYCVSPDVDCKGKFIGGPFWDHVLEYWYESLKNPNKVLFVTYEELKKQTEVQVKRIAEFIGCGFTAEEEVSEIVKLCSFESLSSLEVNRQGKLPNGIESNAFFRKGETGGWRDTLSESLADVIDRTTEQKFGGSGLKFSC
uniref:Sulfotransferase n=1 Tax=Brassica campestris TaxID=3711 RepID=M4DLI8_BRACM